MRAMPTRDEPQTRDELSTRDEPQTREELVRLLRERIGQIEFGHNAGFLPQIDEAPEGSQTVGLLRLLSAGGLLPRGGLPEGGLVEWLEAGAGGGAAALALLAAREVCQPAQDRGQDRGRGPLVIVDGRGEFYPLAGAGLGIDLSQTLVVRPRRKDEVWALDQALRCPGVGAVLGWSGVLGDRTFRRLQLAAEAGGGMGLLVRPPSARSAPSWAHLRFSVAPLVSTEPLAAGRRRLRVELVRCRGGASGKAVEVELDETGVVHLAARLAPAAPLRRAAGT